MKPAIVAILAGVGAIAAIYLITRGARAASDTAGQIITTAGRAIDPTSPDNLAYRGVNAVGGILTQQGSDFSLGVWLWEKLNPDKVAQEKALLGGTPPVVGDRAAIGGGSRGFY